MLNTPLNIAVIDDEEDIHKIFDFYFKKDVKKELVKLFHFNNGKEILNFLKEDSKNIKIVLILSDINMPEMDGLTLLEILKQDYPNIEVDLITAYNDEEYINKGKALGASNIFNKPIDFDNLKTYIYEKYDIS